ncbi:MAG: AraC family transcriptional regulator [Clostridia bacterium]|nr:AraC family transcriptional regulator [Clostridia bacterium]
MLYENSLNNIQQGIKLGMIENMYIRHEPQWFEERTKYEYTIWSVARGNIYIKVNDVNYVVSAGEVVLFSPGTTCTARTDDGGCEFVFEQFSLELGNSMNILSNLNFSGIINKKYIGGKCLEFCKNMNSGKVFESDFSLNAYALFFPYILHITDLVSSDKIECFTTLAADSPVSGIWKAMAYINDFFKTDVVIKDVAKRYGFSEKHFITLFTNRLGITPKQYLIRCRMRYATHLLIHSDTSIQNIAAEIGYSDLYSFSKAFKRCFGESPTIFRRYNKQ